MTGRPTGSQNPGVHETRDGSVLRVAPNCDEGVT
jgi:hypothetical protein